MEELPAAVEGAGRARLRLPEVRVARDAQEEDLRQGRRHVHQGEGGQQEDDSRLNGMGTED